MILREAIRQVRGFRYMIEQLDICSAVGRRVLYDLPWLDSKSRLEAEFERIQKIMVLFEQPENESRLERLTGKLMQVRDIRGTIGRMAMEQVLDDLELFELKTFALCSEEIRGLVEEWRIVFQFLRVQKQTVELIVRDFTRVFAAPESFYAFLRKGGRVQVLHRSRLLAVTINPQSPGGLLLDSLRLQQALEESLQIPVYDVKKIEKVGKNR